MQLKLAQPGVWLAVGMAALVIGLQGAFSLPVAVLDTFLKEALHGSSSGLLQGPMPMAILNILAFGCVIAFGLYLNGLTPGEAFPAGGITWAAAGTITLMITGSVVLLSEIDNLFRSVFPMPEFLKVILQELFSANSSIFGQIFLLVIVAPLTEELLFRGIILRGLLGRCRAASAVLLSAALFALIHLNPWQLLSAFLIGVILGWVYLRTGSVWLCVLGHAVNNGLFLAAQYAPFEVPGLIGEPDAAERPVFQPLWLDLAGAIAFSTAAWLLVRATPEPPPITGAEPPVIEPPVISQP